MAMPCPASERMSSNRWSVSSFASDAVGSSMMRMRASWDSAFAISVSCQYAVPVVLQATLRVDLDPHRLEELDGPVGRRGVVEQPERAFALAGQEDVLGHRQRRDHAELLEDHGDAALHRVLDGGQLDGLALDLDRPIVGLVNATQDLHERGLAGAVATCEGVDLATPDLEIHAVEDANPAEALGDAGHPNSEVGHRRILWVGRRRPVTGDAGLAGGATP